MSRELEREIMEVAQWAHYHRGSLKGNMSIDKKIEFLDKCFDHILWVTARVVQDIQKLEHREQVLNHPLFVPHRVRTDGDIRTAT